MVLRKNTILVIDDEAAIRSSFRHYLEDYDYEVIEAENGRVGLEMFRQHKVDLVLVDLRMPEMDGLEVLSHIHQHAALIPVVVVSGTGVIGDAVRALRCGAWDYILKPIEDMAVLLHVVEKTLEKARLFQDNQQHQEHMEELVAKRTNELLMANRKLHQEIAERKLVETKLLTYQDKLRQLVSQLTLTEEQERKRMAMGLHDRIGQSLAFMKIKLESMQSGKVPQKTQKEIAEVSQTLSDLIDVARSMTYDWGSPTLYALGLKDAIKEWLSEEVEPKYKLKTRYEDDGQDKPLTQDTAAFLFRSVRELLTNVAKHAHAHTVTVSVKRGEKDMLHVAVVDDGVGCPDINLDHLPHKKKGYGLASIKERVEYMGGRMAASSSAGAGTGIHIWVPVDDTSKLAAPSGRGNDLTHYV